MKYLIPFFALLALSSACKSDPKSPVDIEKQKEVWKSEIRATEIAFSEMAGKEGIAKAFLYFADEDAVLSRRDTLFKGKESIARLLYGNPASRGTESLSWEPDFVEVADSGDLGYTYGRYTYSFDDSLGQRSVQQGIFHTVWKRQADGSWKFVWD